MSTKRKYGFLCALMAVLLIMGMLAGCGKGESDSSKTDGSTADNSENETDETSGESEGEGESTGGGITFPYTGDPVVYKGYAYEGPDQSPDLPCQKAWREHIGNISIEYEFAAYGDYEEKAKIYLATNDIPDVMPVADLFSVTRQYGETGCLLDFNQYADYMPNLQEYRKQYPCLDYICNSKNQRFAIKGIQPIDYAGESYFVNMDVLNAAGQEVPDTLDEMLSVMRAIKANDPSITPWQSYWNIDYTQGWFARMLGAKINFIYFDTEDNTYKCAYREESAKRKELIELMATMYAEGLINPQIAEMSFEQELNEIASGNWAFTAVYNVSPEKEIFKVDQDEDLPFDIQVMTAPADPDGVRRLPIAYQHDMVGGWGYVCSSDVEHPELLAAYMDEVVSPFGRDIFNYGIEGETFDYIDGVPTIRDGIDYAEYGIKTQYEVWMIGMGPLSRESDAEGYKGILEAQAYNLKNFQDGTVQADYTPQVTIFDPEAATEQANLQNTFTTYVEENEAKFIYGQRSMDEWDAYVQELEGLASIDDLLALYNEAETIVNDPERIFVAE